MSAAGLLVKASLAPLLLAGTLLAAPALAASESHWYQGGVELVKGAAPLQVPVSGKATILIVGLRQIRCAISGREQLSNPAPAGAGEDSMSSLTFSRCTIKHPFCPETRKLIEVLALGLPWQSQLLQETGPATDSIGDAQLEVRCKADHTLHLLQGRLAGPVGEGRIELEGRLTEADPHREAIVTLLEHLKAKHGKITAH